MNPNIETVYTPELYKYHNQCQNVVLIDVARFTSTMVTALANGAVSVETYPDKETPLRLKEERGYLIAGEQRGLNIEGYDYNNSPLSMTRVNVAGRRLAFCTSNGTYARSIISGSESIFAASFLNSSAVAGRLISEGKSVMFLCSGRDRKPAVEDILLAGQLAEKLLESGKFQTGDESTNMAIKLYNLAKDDIKGFTMSMYPRMAYMASRHPAFAADIDFALCNQDIYDIVPMETSELSFSAANGKNIK